MTTFTGLSGQAAVEQCARTFSDSIFVSTMSSVGLLDKVPGDRLVYPAVAMMGAASGIGLGLALGKADKTVVVLDGDGSLLMELGSLVTIASSAVANLVHVVLHNRMWFHETADLVIPGGGLVDFCGLASAAGYIYTAHVKSESELQECLEKASASHGPAMVVIDIERSGGSEWGATNEQPDLPDQYFERVPRQARELTAALTG